MPRQVTLYIAASLDGFIARRDGTVDWLPAPTGENDYGYAEFWAGIDTVVMGRKTYDTARQLEGEAPFAGRRCVVFSRRRETSREARVEFVHDEPGEWVRQLRRERGRGIWLVGGGEIVRECFEAGVVGEIVLTLIPVLLGDGLPLFLPRGGTTWLQLKGSRSFANGLVQLTYVPAMRRAATEVPHADRSAPEARSAVESSRRTAAAVGVELVRAWAVRQRAA